MDSNEFVFKDKEFKNNVRLVFEEDRIEIYRGPGKATSLACILPADVIELATKKPTTKVVPRRQEPDWKVGPGPITTWGIKPKPVVYNKNARFTADSWSKAQELCNFLNSPDLDNRKRRGPGAMFGHSYEWLISFDNKLFLFNKDKVLTRVYAAGAKPQINYDSEGRMWGCRAPTLYEL